MFRAIKTPGVGESMVLDDNAFIEKSLPGTVATPLDPQDLDVYRRPYPTRESRLPLLRWARSMPLDGDPADVVARIERYDEWLATTTEVPKLLLTFEPGPGAMMTQQIVGWCAANIAALEVERLGPAGHHTRKTSLRRSPRPSALGWTSTTFDPPGRSRGKFTRPVRGSSRGRCRCRTAASALPPASPAAPT